MKNKLSALPFRDKIFFAYGFVFLLMFVVIFASTNFLIGIAFKREIETYVETLQVKISNSYQAFLNQVEKEVHTTAAEDGLRRAIKTEAAALYQPTPDFNIFEYGTSARKLLPPRSGATETHTDTRTAPRRTYTTENYSATT